MAERIASAGAHTRVRGKENGWSVCIEVPPQPAQVTLTHCGGVALPLARLPPPSLVPARASIPCPRFLLALLPLSELPVVSPGASSAIRMPVSRFPFAALPDSWLPLDATT